ncbi:MAG TPA: hypothetical protein ENN94_03425 [Geoalkalibacter subterraneus]|uniref:TraB family protein n=1 Tax=Geoalkalibacter subterraneus TaxID=483547 RepID=A0A831PNF5_9BACT|nr:hypothetical protein [Geoalkalibacter subterraneus]
MRKPANLFLILFIASAVSGVLHGLSQQYGLFPIVAQLHRLLWGACLINGFFVYLGFGFNRHLPKRVLIPLLLWLLWALVAYWPLDYFALGWGQLVAYIGQLIFGILLLKVNSLLNNKSLLLTPEQFVGPSFSFSTLIKFVLISLVVLPVSFLLVAFSVVSGVLDRSTGGFVQLRPDGLYMQEKVYHLDGKDIRLAGMIHLGHGSYFSDLIASIPAERTLILAEGVSDEAGLMSERFSYGNIAGNLGLASQEQFHFAGRRISLADLRRPYREDYDGPHILDADIDLQQFDPRSVEVLNALARYFLSADSLWQGYLEFNRWAEENITVDTNRVLMHDLIDKRNQAVIDLLPQALERYDVVVVPWGALHMKGIETAVRAADFYLHDTYLRRSISFFDLPLGRIVQQLRSND